MIQYLSIQQYVKIFPQVADKQLPLDTEYLLQVGTQFRIC